MQGRVHEIGTSQGADTKFQTQLYQRSINAGAGVTRLSATEAAVSSFVNSVAAKAEGTNGNKINHRVDVGGFASRSSYGNNTELLSVAGTNSGTVGVAYNNIQNSDLKNVLQNMDSEAGKAMAARAVGALSAEGATRVDLGLEMARRILEANPVSEGEKRNRVVIVFTDGSPTNNSDFEMDVANAAISEAQTIKNMGAAVYAIGAFPGADATSPGEKPGRYTSTADECNWFMQKVSSNNGVARSPSYYLSAADAGAMTQIFQQIASQIETGGSMSSLTAESVLKDVVSPQFSLAEGSSVSGIRLETYRCTGVDASGGYTWEKNSDAMGAEATVVTGIEDQISVTGFDFSENYVGSVTRNGAVSYRGNKLVVAFEVNPREGFLGGNNVPTNSSAGIYMHADDRFPVRYFETPIVNVPIQPIVMGLETEKVYLGADISMEEMLYNTDVRVGNVHLDLDAEDFGLMFGQGDYVNIEVKVTDENGQEITEGFQNLLVDRKDYHVTVTVSPKEEPRSNSVGTPAVAQTKTDNEYILVFKPVLTFKDTESYYGAEAAADFAGNLVSTAWKYENLTSTDENVLMIGEEPKLDLVYTADATKLQSGKYTKQDVPVAVTVSIDNLNIGEYTTFVHQDCDPECGWAASNVPGNPAFLVHIKTCALTVTKTGGAENEPYIFDVLKDGIKYSEVTLLGNSSETLYELPVGNYTIAEKTPWSWRYTPAYGDAAALTPANPEGTLTCTNTKTIDTWLNGFSAVLRNIYGSEN